jgi:hypothetical protein
MGTAQKKSTGMWTPTQIPSMIVVTGGTNQGEAMVKAYTKVTVPGVGKGVTVAPVDKKGKQEVWIDHTTTLRVDAKKLEK